MQLSFQKLKTFANRHIAAFKLAWELHGLADGLRWPPNRDNVGFYYVGNQRRDVYALSDDFANVHFTQLVLVIEGGNAGARRPPRQPLDYLDNIVAAAASISQEEAQNLVRRLLNPYAVWAEAVTPRLTIDVFLNKWTEDLIACSAVHLENVDNVEHHVHEALLAVLGSGRRTRWNKKLASSAESVVKMKHQLDALVPPAINNSALLTSSVDHRQSRGYATINGTTVGIVDEVLDDLNSLTDELTTFIRQERVLLSKTIQWHIYHLGAPERRRDEKRIRDQREEALKQKWDTIDEEYHFYYTLYSTALPALSQMLLCLGPSLISEYSHVEDGSNFGVYIGVYCFFRVLRYFCHKYDKAPFAALCGMIVCEIIVQGVLILVAALKP